MQLRLTRPILDFRRPPRAPAPLDHRPFVGVAFRRVLRREPTEVELEHYAGVTSELGAGAVLDLLFDSNEHQHRNRVDDLSEFYAGHFYSPVADPEELAAAGFRVDRQAPESTIAGIDLRPAEMLAFWDRHRQAMLDAPLNDQPTAGARYYADQDVYAWGDALVLYAMMREARPRRVVEVGSGFSSAAMLDVADHLGLDTRFTFVEPYPERLFSLLSETDRTRCEILQLPVQQAPLELFERLGPNDILFIDSTHVSKAGSDVNHELFEVLPRLASGVLVHFHDIFWPFEYPDEWIFERRRSWNEAYLLRAFLMGNRDFEIAFFNDYFRARHRAAAEAAPRFCENPGGGLWLRRT